MPSIFKSTGVYKVTNQVNGKFYIGSSVWIENRWKNHKREGRKERNACRSLLYPAMRKYGVENFTFEIVEECEPIKEVLLEREQHYIDTLQPEYNLLPKAGSRLGSKASPETIAKQRLQKISPRHAQALATAAKAYMNDPEIKEKYRQLRKGKTFEEIFGEERGQQIRQFMSKHRLENPVSHTEEALAKMLLHGFKKGNEPWNRGTPMTDKTKAKLRASLKKTYDDPDVRERISKAMQAVWCDPEFAAMMSEMAKARWRDPIKRDRMVRCLREAAQRPEDRKRRSEIAKQNFDPDHQRLITEAARIANTGKARSEEVRKRISESNLTSEARKAYNERRTGVPRSEEVRAKVSESLKNSEKLAAFHKGRIGKSRGNNPSGHYGVIWDKNRSKWQVRIRGKLYGRYDNLDDAVAKSKELTQQL